MAPAKLGELSDFRCSIRRSRVPLSRRQPSDAYFSDAVQNVPVLVVQDNEEVGRFALEMLGDLGYRTRWISNADAPRPVLACEELFCDVVFCNVIISGSPFAIGHISGAI